MSGVAVRLGKRFLTPLLLAAAYVGVTLLTQAPLLGDTIDYVIEAERFDGRFWDFGHLLWVPLGWLFKSILGTNDRGDLLLIFFTVNWLTGLVCVLLAWATARCLTGHSFASAFTALAVVVSHAFLNDAQTGSSYIPGLAWLFLAVYLLARHGKQDSATSVPWWGVLGVGVAITGAVCAWFPFVLVVPAVLLLPVILFGRDGGRLRLAFLSGVVAALLGGGLYLTAALSMNVTTLQGVRDWMAQSSHGISFGGLPRMVFGLARSFIHMAQDGLLFKRYLLGDPYNPVTLTDLVGLSLWKVALFYVALACLLVSLTATHLGRRLLVVLGLAAVPVIAFGVCWQGGDMERYLPLYPLLFPSLAVVLAGGRWASWLRWVPAGFFACCAVVNVWALSLVETARQHDQLEARVRELRPLLTPGSTIIVVRDELVRLPRDFPFDPETRALPVVQGVTLGTTHTHLWRPAFAELSLRTWSEGGDLWVSRRLFSASPHPDSTWAEGDDPHVAWKDVVGFFAAMETADPVGGDDGFVRLPPTAANRAHLESFLAPPR